MIELSALRRPAEDILGRSIRFTIGGVDYVLPVRSIRANREWKARLDASTVGLLSALEDSGDDLSSIYAALAQQGDVLIDLLIDYAPDGALPTREEIEDLEPDATMDVLHAVSEVWRAASPLVALSLDAMAATVPIPDETSSPPTSGPRKSTGGRPKRSRTA